MTDEFDELLLDIEEWRELECPAGYAVSNIGRVKRVKPYRKGLPLRILSLGISDQGYSIVAIKENGKTRTFKVSRLVCQAFYGPPPTPKHEAAHGDGNKRNNYVGNLRWATRLENNDDRHRLGEFVFGFEHGSARLTTSEVLQIFRSTEARTTLAARFGISKGHVYDIKTRRRRGHETALRTSHSQ